MANVNNLFETVVNQVTGLRANSSTRAKPLSVTQLVNLALSPSSAASNTSSGALGAGKDLTSLAFNAKSAPLGIQFGSPSNSRINAPASTSEWSSLLKQTASGGIASAAGGSGFSLLGSLGGIGGLISGIAHLFSGGSKNPPPPLVEFQLPQSQQQTLYVGTTGNSAQQTGPLGVASPQQSSIVAVSTPTAQYQSSQIVQSVKQALLNSSSLNDVIAEI